MSKFSKIKEIFKRKEKQVKKPLVEKIIDDHKSSSSTLKAINPAFQEELQKANALNLINELFDYSISSVDSKAFSSVRFMDYFKKREGRVLKKTKTYILQYLKSPTQKGIDLSLTLITDKGVSNHLVRLVSLKSASEEALSLSSIVKKKYALVLEQLGVRTIKAEFSLFDPVHKMDISVYPEFSIKEASALTGSEKEAFLGTIEKKYKQFVQKNPDFKDTKLVDISKVGTNPLPIFKVLKSSADYSEGEIIVDTRVS